MSAQRCKTMFNSRASCLSGKTHLMLLMLMISYVDAQSQVQQIHFVPKNYFLQPRQLNYDQEATSSQLEPILDHPDISRNPRHLAPDRIYVGPEDHIAKATTSLRTSTLDRAGNPVLTNANYEKELKLDISNNNPTNNQFEAKILPNSLQQPPSSFKKSQKDKIRRIKTRPPKNVITYALPEQSFYASGSNGETSYSEPDSREAPGLRSFLGDESRETSQEVQPQETPEEPPVKEFPRNENTYETVIVQKKAQLGQCMAQCIDAILS